MHRGFIKVHRKILENPVVFKDSDHAAIWFYLLLNATHKKIQAVFKGKSIFLKPGELLTGRISMSEKLKINQSKVQRVMKFLESEHLIEQQAGNRNRLVKILSWETYQNVEQQNEQQVNNKRTTDEQQVNTNKNVKKDKNVKNEYPEDFLKFYNAYPKKRSKAAAAKTFSKAIKKYPLEHILKQMEGYVLEEEAKKTKLNFYKDPSTFLNQCLDDDFTEALEKNTKGLTADEIAYNEWAAKNMEMLLAASMAGGPNENE